MEIFEFDLVNGRYRYDRSFFACPYLEDVWSAWAQLPNCGLTVEQQKQHIDYVYGSKEIRELLAPPLQEIELLSLEMVFKRSFGPLLRHYLQNISREVVLAENQSFVLPRIIRGELGHRPAFYVFVNDCGGSCCYTAVSHVSDTVFRVVNDDSISHGLPLYEILSRPAMSREAINRKRSYPSLSELITAEEQRGLTLGGLGRLRVNIDQNPKRIINEVLRSAEQVTRCLQTVTQAAVQIQKQFRLWKWRKDVVWSPYTEDGRNQLLWKARMFIKELHLQ